VVLLTAGVCFGQGGTQTPPPAQSASEKPGESGISSPPDAASASTGDAAPPAIPASKQQPKRILGVMPNYRAVSAGEIPPPPTARQAFKIATQNSFDYSAFVFVGITSLMAWGTDTHPQLRSGIAGYGRYYWRFSLHFAAAKIQAAGGGGCQAKRAGDQ